MKVRRVSVDELVRTGECLEGCACLVDDYRVRYHGTGDKSVYSYDETNKLRREGEPNMNALEEAVRKRLWSVAKDVDPD